MSHGQNLFWSLTHAHNSMEHHDHCHESSRVSQEEIDKLFDNTMKGHWEKVVEAYKKGQEFREAKITSLEDTALHLAVSDGKTEVALELMGSIVDEEDVLSIANKRGDTALHLAAAMGDVEVCQNMAERDPNLITVRNRRGETPLYSAALHGKQKAFLCLHSFCKEKHRSFRKNNGDTILHAAISAEHFSKLLKFHFMGLTSFFFFFT